MRFKTKLGKYKEWTSWYAWYPVKRSHEEWVWLESMYRKGTKMTPNGKFRWMYKDLFDVLKSNEDEMNQAEGVSGIQGSVGTPGMYASTANNNLPNALAGHSIKTTRYQIK